MRILRSARANTTAGAAWRLARLCLILILAGLPALPAGAQPPSETDGLRLELVDAGMSTAYIMRHRPFVLPDHLTPAFDFDSVSSQPVSDADARAALERFLRLRNLPPDRILEVMARFDDATLARIIPAANLRAALLMLSDWEPYKATIDAILDGANESGHPFETVDFRPLEFSAAVATLQVAYATGQPRLLVSDRYRNETPQQLIPVLVHESMHDGVDNSFEEEIIASLLDSLAHAEVLSIDPEAANTGTELAAYNNVQLFALMNSIGRRGAGYVGIETSFDGDAYLGAGLERFDADSIRAGIAGDPWYGQLPRGGSQGGAVLAALLARFENSGTLVAPDRFSDDALAVIDQGVGLILTPRKVRALAVDLQLSLTAGSDESYEPGEPALSPDRLASRPFRPSDSSVFDLRSMRPAPTPLDIEFARAALRESLLQAGLDEAAVRTAVTELDDPAVTGLAPDPTLRAGLLMLHRDQRWSPLLASAIDGANASGIPVHIDFAELPAAVPAVWEDGGWGGEPVVWVNAMLRGERPELLATAISEGLLLEGPGQSATQAVIAAALSTTLWADLVAGDPTLGGGASWGTISRNRDLLALLNSQPFDPGNPTGLATGLRLPTGGDGDVLPGLLRDAGSFLDYVLQSPRASASDLSQTGVAPAVLTELLRWAGIEPSATSQSAAIDEDFLAQIDSQFGGILPAAVAVDAAIALGLTVSSASS
jgi:hypothetical protein